MTMPDLSERLAEIEERCEAAMLGPLGFIAHARTDIPFLLAEVRRLLAEREWQPIETAPKDGTAVLLHIAHPLPEAPNMVIGRWGIYTLPSGRRDTGWFWYGSVAGAPIHWQPLPAPPTPAERRSAALDALGELDGEML